MTTTTKPTRADLEAAIAEGKARYDRMPVHFEAKRLVTMKAIMALVDQWIAAEV